MIRRVLQIIGTLIGITAGAFLSYHVFPELVTVIGGSGLAFTPPPPWTYSVAGGGLFGILFYFITPPIVGLGRRVLEWCEGRLKKVPTQDIILVVFGMIVSLLLSLLISYPFYKIPHVGGYIALLITLGLVFFGVRFILSRKEEFSFLTSFFNRSARAFEAADNETFKILDTSAIIDGRIVDICKTGFLEGVIVVAGFVLEELQHIADSPDLLKRNRGRRGLDILNKIQKEMDIPVQIYEGDFEELSEVDSKLVRLSKVLNGKIITNDFNLNKVCELQGITVLNINELANAVKPVVLPGEEMSAQIIKDGKEIGQGVAYLDDGTMIVVEGGKRHIGETIEVLVTSVLQTAAGRMIFAKPKSSVEKVSGV